MIGKIQHKKRLDADGEWQDVKIFIVDGKEVTEPEFDKAFPPQPLTGGTFGGTPTSGWPIISDVLAVHPRQRAEAIADAKAKGVSTDFTERGQPILRDRDHRKRYCEAYGFHDRDGGYGDPQPGARKEMRGLKGDW